MNDPRRELPPPTPEQLAEMERYFRDGGRTKYDDLGARQAEAIARVRAGAARLLAEEVETLRDIIARVAMAESWDEVSIVLSECDVYPDCFDQWLASDG